MMTRRLNRSALRTTLAVTTALAGSFALTGIAGAQDLPTGGTQAAGVLVGSTLSGDMKTQTTTVTGNTVVDWTSFNVNTGFTQNFQSTTPATPVAVLNRDLNGAGNLSNILGTLSSASNVSVWVYNPNGIVIGAGAKVAVGSLILTTYDPTAGDTLYANFLSGGAVLGGGVGKSAFAFAGTTGSISVDATAQINLSAGNRGLVMVAPQITSAGKLTADGSVTGTNAQDVALVTAQDVVLTYTSGSPLAVQINAGTQVAGSSQLVSGTVAGKNVTFALVSDSSITDALLDVSANVTAAASSNRGIVLFAGNHAPGPGVSFGGAAAATSGVVSTRATGPLTAKGATADIALLGNGAVQNTGTLTSARGVVIDGEGAVAQSSAVLAGGDYTVSGVGTVMLGGAAAVTQQFGNALVTAVDGTITTGAGTVTLKGGNAQLTTAGASAGDIALGKANLSLTGTLTVASRDAANAVTIGDIDANALRGSTGGAADSPGLTRTAAITLGNVTTAQALSLTAPTLKAASLTTTGGTQAITLNATDLTVTGAATTLGANSDIVADSQSAGSGAAAFGAIGATRDVKVGQTTPYNSLTVAGAVSGRDLLATTRADIVLHGATLSRDVTLTGARLEVDNATDATRALTLNAAGAIVGGDLSGGSIDAKSGVSVDLLSAKTDTGDLSLVSNDQHVLVGGANSAGAATLTSANDFVKTDALVAVGNVDITAGTTVGGATQGQIGLTSTGGTVQVAAGTTATIATVAGANGVTVDAGSIAATRAESANGAVALTAKTGALTLTSGSAKTDFGAEATLGSVSITGAIDAGGAYKVLAAGAVNLGVDPDAELQRANGAVTITAGGTLTGGPGLTVRSGSGALTLDAAGYALGGTTLLAGNGNGTLVLSADPAVTNALTFGDVTANRVDQSFGGTTTTGGFQHAGDLTFGHLTLGTAGAANSIQSTAGTLMTGAVTLGQGGAAGITVLGGASGVAIGGRIDGRGDLTVASSGGAVGVQDANLNGALTLNANGALTGTTLQANALTGTGSSIGLTSAETKVGALSLVAGAGNVTVQTAKSAGTGEIRSTGGAILADTLSATGNLTVAAATGLGGATRLRTDLSSGAVLDASGIGATADVGTASGKAGATIVAGQIDALGVSSVNGDVTLTANSGTLSVINVAAGGAATLTTMGGGQGITVDTAAATSDLTVSSTGAIAGKTSARVTSLTSSAGALLVTTSNGAATLGTTAGRTGNTISASSLDVISAASAAGAVQLTASDDALTLGSGSAAGDLTASAISTATINGAISAGGAYGVTGSSVSLGADGNVTQAAGGAVTIRATNGAIQGGANLLLTSGGTAPITLGSMGTTDFLLGGTTLRAGDLGRGNVEFDQSADTNGRFELFQLTANRVDQSIDGGEVVQGTLARTGRIVIGDYAGGVAQSANGGLTIGTAGAANAISSNADLLLGGVTIGGGAATPVVGETILSGTTGIAIAGAVAGNGALTVTTSDASIAMHDATLAGRLTLSAVQGGLTGGVLRSDALFAEGGDVTLTSATTTDAATGQLNLTATNGSIHVASTDAAGLSTISQSGAAGGIMIDTARAVGDLTLNGAGTIGGTLGGRTALTSTAGAVSATADGDILAATVQGATDAGLTSNGGAVDATRLVAGNGLASIAAATTATLGSALSSLGSVQVSAGGNVRVLDGVSAFGNYTVAGADVTLGEGADAETQAARGNVTIDASGLLTGGPGLTLIADSDNDGNGLLSLEGDGGIAFGGTTLNAGSNGLGDILVTSGPDTSAALVFGDVTANRFDQQVGGGEVTTGSLERTGSIAFAALTLGTAGAANTIQSTGSTFRAASVTLGRGATAAGATTLAGSTGATVDGLIGGRGDLTLASMNGAVTVHDATLIGGLTLNALGAVSGGTLDTTTLDATGRAVTLTGATTRGGALNLTATGGDVSAGMIDATGAATLRAQGTGNVLVDTATASDGLTVDAAGAVQSRGAGRAMLTTTGGTLAVTAGGAALLGVTQGQAGATVQAAAIDATSVASAGGAVDLTATKGDLRVGGVTAATTARLRTIGATGDIAVNSVAAPGDVTLVSAGAVHDLGNGRSTLTSTGGLLSVTAAGDATLANVAGQSGTTVTAATIAATAANSTNGAVALTATGGGLSVGTVDAGTGATLRTTGATGDIRTDDVRATGTLTVGSVGSVGGLGGSRADLRSTGADVAVTAAGAATLGTAQAHTALNVAAASIDILQATSDTGAATLTAATGPLTVGNVTAASAALTAKAGTATLGTATTSGALSLTAGGTANLTGATTIGTALTVRGAAVNMGVGPATEVQSAGGAIDVTATNGTITGGEGLTLRANADGVGGELLALDATGGDVAFAPSSILAGGSSRQSDIGIRVASAGRSVTLGTVDARTLGGISADRATFGALATAGAITATGPVTTVNTLALTSTGGAIQLADATVTGAGQGITLRTSAPAGATIAATTLTAPGLITVDARGAATIGSAAGGTIAIGGSSAGVGAATAAGALSITTTGGLLSLGTGKAGTTAMLTAAGGLTIGTSLTGGGDVTTNSTGTTTIPAVTSTGGGIVITAGSAGVTSADAAQALAITTNVGALTLGTGKAGTTANLDAKTVLTIGKRLDSGATATLSAGGDAALALVHASGGDIVATAGGAVSGAGGTRAILTADAGGVRVTAAGAALLGPVQAATLARVDAASIDVSTVKAGQLALTAIGGGIALGTGTISGTATLDASGTLGIDTLTAGGDVTATAGSASTITTIASTAGAVSVTGGTIAAGSATSATALALRATSGTLDLGTGSAGTTASLRASGTITLTDRLDSGATATVDAGGDARLALVKATGGDVMVGAGGAVSGVGAARADLSATGVGGDVRVTAGGAALLGPVFAADAVAVTARSIDVSDVTAQAGTLGLTATGGDIVLGTGRAGGAAALDATGTITIGSLTSNGLSLKSGDASTGNTLDGTGPLTIVSGGVVKYASASGSTVDVTGTSVTLGTVAAKDTLALTATNGDVSVDTGTSGGDATLRATGAIALGTLDSGGAGTVLAGTDATGTRLTSVGAASVTAGGAATFGTLDGGSVKVNAASVDLTDTTAGTTLAVTSTGGPLSIGTGLAGTTATLSAAGPLAITTSLTGGGDVTTTSTGTTTIAAITSTGGAVGVTGSDVGVTSAAAATTLGLTATEGDVKLGTGISGSDATVRATGAVSLGTLDSGGAGTVLAGTDATGTRLTSVGAASVTAGGAATFGTLDGGSVKVNAASVDLTDTTAGTTLLVTSTGGPLSIGTGSAGTTATLSAAGPLAITTSLTGGGDVTTTSTGTTTIAAITSTEGAIGVTASGVDVTSAAAATTLGLTATEGDVKLGTGISGSDATVRATGAVALGTLDSGGAGTVLAGTDATGTRLTSVGAASVTAGGAATFGTLDGGSVEVNAASVDLTDTTAGTTLLVTSTGGPLSIGTGSAGTTATLSAAGPLAITTSLTGGGDVTTTSTGTTTIAAITSTGGAVGITGSGVDVTTASAGTTLDVTSTEGDVTLGTGTAGGAATLTASGALASTTLTSGGAAVLTGGTNLSSGTLNAGGAATLTATGTATLGQTTATGALAVTANGIQAGATRAGTSLALTSGGAITLASGAAGTTARIDAKGPLTVTGALTGGGTVTTTSIAATRIGTLTSTGGALSVTASGGDITIGTGSASGDATFDTTGTAALGAVSAANIRVKASDAAITGAQTATTSVTFENRSPTTLTFALGAADPAAATGRFALSDAELNLVAAPTLTIAGGSGNVDVGAVKFVDAAGSKMIDVQSTGRIQILGAVAGTGVARTIRFGDPAAGTADPAATSVILLKTTVTGGAIGGGSLAFGTGNGNANIVLQAARIGAGQDVGFLTPLGIANPTGIDVGTVLSAYVGNANSALYNPTNAGGAAYPFPAPAYLTAQTLNVRYSQYALFQNTGQQGLSAGVTLGAVGAPGLLVLAGPGGTANNAFSLFGTINGVSGSATAVIGPGGIAFSGLYIAGSRVNGCLIGSGAGCLSSVVTQPVLNVFDSSRLDVFRSADDLALPFDPVIGANNEALFSGITLADLPITDTPCTTDATDPSCKQPQTEGK